MDINTFRIEVELATQQFPHFQLTKWIDDTRWKKKPIYIPKQGKKHALVPDGYFVIQAEKRHNLFLELDRDTMSRAAFRQKIRTYYDFVETKTDQKDWGITKFRLLTVTTNLTHLQHLKTLVEKMQGKNRFWFGLLSELTADNLLTQPIWYKAQEQGRFALLA